MEHGLVQFLKAVGTDGCEHAHAYLGCHFARRDETDGYLFRVWAPCAVAVSVVGDFNFWNVDDLPMQPIGGGVWETFSAYAKPGGAYKFCVRGADGRTVYKTDPYARRCCALPDTSGMIEPPARHIWHDGLYRARKKRQNALQRPMNIYEVHAGSWKRHEDGGYYTFDDLARELIPYVKGMGYTHIELRPVMEFPYEP